jgi:hypothetical protein
MPDGARVEHASSFAFFRGTEAEEETTFARELRA